MNTDKYKKLLLAEKARLESELSTVGEKIEGSSNGNGWEPTPPEDIEHESDPTDQADDVEEFVERVAIEGTLEEQLNIVKKALKAIEGGTYGKCSVCGKEIEEGRLSANPAALTCVEHM